MWFSKKKRREVLKRLAFIDYILLYQKSTDIESILEASNQMDLVVASIYGSKSEGDAKWTKAFTDLFACRNEFKRDGVSDFVNEYGTERAKRALRSKEEVQK